MVREPGSAPVRDVYRGAFVFRRYPVEVTFVLQREQRAEFESTGVLRLPGFFRKADVAAMASAVWTDLETRFGIKRDCRDTWTVERPAQFQALIARGVFDALDAGYSALADAFLGAGTWMRPKHF